MGVYQKYRKSNSVTKLSHFFHLWDNKKNPKTQTNSNLYHRLYLHVTNYFCDCLGDRALPATCVLNITSTVSCSHCGNSQSQHFVFHLQQASSYEAKILKKALKTAAGTLQYQIFCSNFHNIFPL